MITNKPKPDVDGAQGGDRMKRPEDISILIVDDEPDNLQAIADVFRRSNLNYRILRSPDGAIALKMARLKQPDLIITDWEMPVMDGITLIKQLRAMAETRHTPVIMCTGVMVKSENLQTALEAGASDYIRKPVDPIELIARTNSMLKLGESFTTIQQQHAELQENYKQIEQMSRTDPLTGLSNRRDILAKADQVINAAARNRKPFTIALADIDHFKQFNDRFGHDCGDHILAALANIFEQGIRKQDLVGRWGGEEFILLLPDTDLAGGMNIAEKIRKDVENHAFQYEGKSLSLTLTLGLAENDNRMDFYQCLKQADTALYSGKSRGRNQVVTSSP